VKEILVLDSEGIVLKLQEVGRHRRVALGYLSKQIEVDEHGKILDLKNTVNGMVVSYNRNLLWIAASDSHFHRSSTG
jgi:hypothetical protein